MLAPTSETRPPTLCTAAIALALAVGSVAGVGISSGLHVFDGAGGVGPGNGLSGPYCFPSRKSPWTRPRMSENLNGGGSVPGMSTSG